MNNNGTKPRFSMNTLKASDSTRSKFAFESAGFAASELISMGTSLGVVAIFDKVMPTAVMDKATNLVAKVVVEPYLDTIEKTLAKCHLAECQTDETKSREERACRLARGIVVFGSAYLTALGVKYLARDKINHFTGVSDKKPLSPNATTFQKVVSRIPIIGSTSEANMINLTDEAVHIGSLIYLNTKASKFTDEHIQKTASTLEKLGMSHKKSMEVASMLWVWEVPNGLGMSAGIMAIAGRHAYGWPQKHEYQKIFDVISGAKSKAAH